MYPSISGVLQGMLLKLLRARESALNLAGSESVGLGGALILPAKELSGNAGGGTGLRITL